MALNYAQLADKLRLLARPRIRVQHTPESLRFELLAKDNPELVLVTHDFIYKDPEAKASPAKAMQVASAYLETAAMMLENLPKPFSATSFTQDLYNAGFWVNPAGGSSIFRCKLVSIVYEPHLWTGEAQQEE
jgi:hypothetical protein